MVRRMITLPNTEPEREITRIALGMYMCWLETGDCRMSAEDAKQRKLQNRIKPLNAPQIAKVNMIREAIGLLPYGE